MKRTTFRRSAGIAALALTTSLSLAACGSEDNESTASAGSETSQTPSASPSDSMSESASESPMEGAGAQTFGEGCAAIPTDPSDPGSFEGMATEPVATAASGNPLLTTLVAAVKKAGLVDTLNSAQDITVFAPTDDAFAKIPPKQLKAVLKDKKTLTAILTHHVVAGQLGPDELAGTHDTLNKDQVTVQGAEPDFTVENASPTSVICGNIPTANATVYVVDTVLMPAM